MRSAGTGTQCWQCDQDAEYCESVPDASVAGIHPSEAGYSLKPLCWLHAAERRQVATARLFDLLVVNGVGHLDRGRCGGDCICLDCDRKYYDHPQVVGAEFLNLLCDGSVVKL